MRRSWLAAGIVLATMLAVGAQTAVVARTGFFAGDFRAFYCAARVAAAGHDPYLTQPLSACERSIGPVVFFKKNPGVTIPAPLPGYAIAALEPLSLLPFGAAVTLWIALLFFAWLACIWALARFAAIGWESALAVFALSLGTLSLPFGEVVPLSVGCICMAAYFAWRSRPQLSAILAAGAMIEPHLGLPACLALAVWIPATRLPLGLCFTALGALSIGALGTAVNLEYFNSVLPSHALSEVTRDTQYSSSAILAALGVAPGAAVRAGGLWYGAMLLAGAYAAGKLAQKSGNNAFVVCIPPAFAVFGGSFIHITQIAAAAPAAVLLATTSRYRTAAVLALLLLVVPWGWVVSPALIVAPLFPVAYLAWYYWKNTTVVLLAAIAATVMIFGLEHLYTLSGLHFGAHGVAPIIDPRLPEASWSAYSRHSSAGSLAAWAVRIPTWSSLALMLVLFFRELPAVRVRSERAPALALAVLFTILPIGAQFFGDRSHGWLGVDFRAYYCAALAQREHRNPYFTQPLHDCEATTPAPYYRAPNGVTVPAPYPPYVLAFIEPLTLLRFGVAVAIWWSLIALAIASGAYALGRIAKQPLAVALAALGLSLGMTSFSTGNMMPLGFAAVIAAAFCMQRGRYDLGAAAIALGMIEPQVALPAALASFVVFADSRPALLAGFGLLAALSVAAGGIPHTLQYLTAVVPAHALAEVSRDNQYSLATIAAAAGAPDATAALLGSVSYIVMACLGVAIAIALARRYDEPALTILVPPAFSLLGGSFVHTAEIAAAVPAALLLFTRAAELRGWLLGALVLLAVPWMNATSIALFAAPFFPVAYLVYTLWRQDRTLALGAALASFAAIAGLFALAAAGGGQSVAVEHFHPAIDPRLAEASWRHYVLSNSTNHPVMWLLRLPTWIALVILAVTAGLLTRKPQLKLAETAA